MIRSHDNLNSIKTKHDNKKLNRWNYRLEANISKDIHFLNLVIWLISTIFEINKGDINRSVRDSNDLKLEFYVPIHMFAYKT